MRWPPRLAAKACWLVLGLALGCGGDSPSSQTPSSPNGDESSPVANNPATGAPSKAIFVDRAVDAGLEFTQFNGMSGDFYMAEVTGSGGALIDYDNDGDLDIYLVQGTMLGEGKTIDDAIFQPSYPLPLTDRLYRNDLQVGEDSTAELRFTDVTAEAGFEASLYGMGVATGDFDNDGWVDLYVTNFGSNQLLRNKGGDGNGNDEPSFTDVTAAAGVDDPRWSVAAAFFDYDRDGLLDLFVGNYIAADLVNRTICRDFIGALDYCGPGAFRSEPDRLFRNLGDGTFVDVTAEAGITSGFGGALGVVTADFNGDGWSDIYVANDSQPNNLWISHGDGTFTDEALLAGCSVNANGKAEASMGVDAGDFDGDGDLDLFMAHLTSETNTLYSNNGRGIFDDSTIATGLGAPSRLFTTFGTAWLDYDNDGWLDLVAVSGAVKKIEALARQNDPFPVHQPNQLFRNLGSEAGASGGAVRFAEVTEEAGEAFELSEVSRGAMHGDLDNDGDTDLVIVNNSGPARLLVNQLGQEQSWLGLRLLGADGRRDMLGARVAVLRQGLPPIWRRVHTDGSFAAANDPRILFGLGESTSIEKIRIEWPDGSIEEWLDLSINGYTTLKQGEGRAIDADTVD
ncbi:MAG: CRTAC1 family protein [Acidobacteriota bacterium]